MTIKIEYKKLQISFYRDGSVYACLQGVSEGGLIESEIVLDFNKRHKISEEMGLAYLSGDKAKMAECLRESVSDPNALEFLGRSLVTSEFYQDPCHNYITLYLVPEPLWGKVLPSKWGADHDEES